MATPFEVEFTVFVHVEAENEDDAYAKAEPIARETALNNQWANYDDCVRKIEKV